MCYHLRLGFTTYTVSILLCISNSQTNFDPLSIVIIQVLNRDRANTARCLIGLVTDVAKEQLIRYVLTVFDDLLQVFILHPLIKVKIGLIQYAGNILVWIPVFSLYCSNSYIQFVFTWEKLRPAKTSPTDWTDKYSNYYQIFC